jgi:hypothetical protein
MNCEILEPFLRKVEQRVSLAEMDVLQQVRRIRELERCGHDSRRARSWLVQLEVELNRHIAYRNYLRRSIVAQDGPTVADTCPQSLSSAASIAGISSSGWAPLTG